MTISLSPSFASGEGRTGVRDTRRPLTSPFSCVDSRMSDLETRTAFAAVDGHAGEQLSDW